ncbi:MAG: bifunctional folylpolyglutamate synthase/dihydrofolate synthase [Holophagales bacterium]|nr:bifunctional folylpolyglutamate synthase/dihydrofolate synthase [Holophagales bacterium]MYD22921.1 bifunctional folylpolyglutamate synthase/dihydrofolate synthase [Holophagales bacterium]MYI32382.1 bifunctional folylpolyglutamate synthase/dihydrofolate synthase [Holophagales bacterium]
MTESRVTRGVPSAQPGGDRDLLQDPREDLAATGVLRRLLVLDRAPLAVTRHGAFILCCAATVTGATKPSASEILDRLEVWGQKLGLEATRSLLDVLGEPQHRVPTVLVAGTNGKGSTSAALASILSAAGFRCGLYTSPHLEHVEERLRIDGVAVSEAELGQWLRRVLEAAGHAPPTYFESLTAAAWLHFAHHGVDAAVFEVGLGGRLDATNVSEPLLSVVTQVARDHAPQLGWTLTSIAGEKAGVMRPGRTCLTWPGRPEVERELRRCAAVCGAQLVDARDGVVFERRLEAGHLSLTTPNAQYRFRAPLAGGHQLTNLALAVRAAEEFCALAGRDLDREAVRQGLEAVHWPGRLEWVDVDAHGGHRRVLFDAAHNPAGAAALHAYLEETGLRFDLLYGSLAEKHPEQCLPRLAERAHRIVLTAFDHPRAASPETLAPLLRAGRAVLSGNAAEALERCVATPSSPTHALVVTGSLYLVGEVRSALRDCCGVPVAARELVTGFRR